MRTYEKNAIMRDHKINDDEEKSSDQGLNEEETNQGTNEEEVSQEAQGIDSDNDPVTEEENNSIDTRTREGDKCEEYHALLQYNLNGDKLFEIKLDGFISNMTKVTLGSNICLALSYRCVEHTVLLLVL